MITSPVIDVHTHCLTEAWFKLLQDHGGRLEPEGRDFATRNSISR